jgi:type I restriction enzyme R subunit
LNPDGKAESSVDDLSLNQALFVQKTALYKEMMKNEHTLSPDDILFAKSLQFALSEQIRNANPNYIGVEKNYQYFEKYSDDKQWDAIGQNELTEIKKYIAPNIVGDIDLPECLRFDLLMNAFSTAKLSNDSRTGSLLGLLYYISKHLTDKKSHIKVVRDKLPELQSMQTDDFAKSSPIEIENLRLKLRDLMRYVEKDFWEPIETDFKDIILSTGDAPDISGMQSFSTEDFRKLDEKVISYINNNSNNALINKITNLQSYTLDDFIEFRDAIKKLAKDDSDFNDLFSDNISIVSFVRRNASVDPATIDTWASQYEQFGFNADQIVYVRELVKYVLQNGYFNRSDLVQREELAFSHLFTSTVDIMRIVEDLEQLDIVLR